MSGSNCCFLTCIQVSEEVGKGSLVFPSLFKNFPQFVVIHTVKDFSVVNEEEVDVFLELPFFFFNDPTDVGSLISGFCAFCKSTLNIWNFMVHVLLKPSLENLSITLLECEMSATVWQFEHCLSLGLE